MCIRDRSKIAEAYSDKDIKIVRELLGEYFGSLCEAVIAEREESLSLIHILLKPNNYTESCMINEADGWRGRNVWYLGRSVRYALKEVTIA